MGKKELKLFYKHPDRILPWLDDAVKKACDENGYEFWASGYSKITEVRDICFDEKDRAGGE